MVDAAEIGRRIRKMRAERGMTQTFLAAKAGISRWELSRIENGRVTPTMRTLEGLAEGLGARLVELLEGGRD